MKYSVWVPQIRTATPQKDALALTLTDPAPEDLFSYRAKGVFALLNVNCAATTQAYLSYSGAAVLTNLNTACNGGDFGDWKGVAGSPQVQGAFGTPGQFVPHGANEFAAMSAIGYTLALEPGT
jgi:hypothetical protein